MQNWKHHPLRLPPLCQSRSVLTVHPATIRQLWLPFLWLAVLARLHLFKVRLEDFTAEG